MLELNRSTILSAAAGIALLSLAAMPAAAEPLQLTEGQLDSVTAGWSLIYGFTGGPLGSTQTVVYTSNSVQASSSISGSGNGVYGGVAAGGFILTFSP